MSVCSECGADALWLWSYASASRFPGWYEIRRIDGAGV